MTDRERELGQPEDEAGEEGEGDSDLVKRLRQQLKDKDKALESATPILMREALREAGFDPNSADGKMLAAVAEARKNPITPEGIKTLAAEFGKEPGTPGEPASEDKPRAIETDSEGAAQDRARRDAQGAADEVFEAGESMPGQENREALLAKIDEAQKAGDAFTVVYLQRQLSNVPK